MDPRLNPAYWALRIGLGAAAFLAGLDKFFNILADWEMYLSPLATKVIPISAPVLMRIFGVIEMIAGLALLAGLTRIAAYVVMVWLLAIAVNLLTTGRFFDIAVRDVEMSIAAFALARLAEVRHRNPERA
ncbi:MAG TPA: DoxX family membrane protein [Thermoanaerobaculia bacterium]|nr:DoxX family membrane protein [Thermoanaerobaculia bacterium]